MIYKQEIQRIKAEIRPDPSDGGGGEFTRDLSIIFDGSTRQAERGDHDRVLQRLIRIDVCAKSVKGDELAQVLNECLSVDYGVRADSLIAAMRDGASVNQAALNRIELIFPKTFNVVCFSHTLDNVGNYFVIPNLSEFGNLWIRLFGHSHKVRLMCQEQTGLKSKSYSETRWWSKWEVYKQLTEQFGDLQEFVDNAERENVAPQISRQLVDFLSDPDKVLSLKLDLAVIVDVGESFVKATYVSEGDGLQVFSCFERLQTVANACQMPHFRNVHAVAVAVAAGDPAKNVAGTGSQKECRAWNSVVFAKIQCRYVQNVERIQGC